MQENPEKGSRAAAIMIAVMYGLVFSAMILFSAVDIASAATCEIYDNHDTNNYLNGLGTDGDGNRYVAGKFTASQNCEVSDIGVYIKRNGGRPDDAVVKIYSDNAGSPGTVSDTGTTLTTTSSFTWATSTGFTVDLVSGTTYWVVLTTAASNASNFHWANHDTGVSKQSTNGSTWNAANNTDKTMTFVINGTLGGGGEEEPPTATTTAATSTDISIDKTADILFYGFFIFGSTMWFTIWAFRRPRV